MPTVPEGRLAVEIVIAGAAMLRLSALVTDPPTLSATRTVNCTVPADCGVPVIAPDELKDKPVGSEPAVTDHE
jgi:hypothetical protein